MESRPKIEFDQSPNPKRPITQAKLKLKVQNNPSKLQTGNANKIDIAASPIKEKFSPILRND